MCTLKSIAGPAFSFRFPRRIELGGDFEFLAADGSLALGFFGFELALGGQGTLHGGVAVLTLHPLDRGLV